MLYCNMSCNHAVAAYKTNCLDYYVSSRNFWKSEAIPQLFVEFNQFSHFAKLLPILWSVTYLRQGCLIKLHQCLFV